MSGLNLSGLSGNFDPLDRQSTPLPMTNGDRPLDDIHVPSHDALLASMQSSEPGGAISPERYFAVLDELAQTRSLECQHIRRIYQLEKALDQAMIYLEELKIKVRDHDDLQDQLAITEDFAYVQQHAIAHLKLQLKEQKQTLINQSCEAREYDEAVQSVLGETEQLVEYQQAELEHLKARLAQDLAEEYKRHSQLEKQIRVLQSSLVAQQGQVQKLESDALAAKTLSASLEIQLTASQQQVRDLSTRLAESQTRFVSLQSQLKKSQLAASEVQELQDSLKRSQEIISEQTHTIATLKRDLAIAETSAARLESERQRHVKAQAKWEQRRQELEAECDRYEATLSDLNQQNVEMQEEIFQQTRQMGEYEAAVQFWKERYLSSQRQLAQLKQLLEREAAHFSEDAAEDLLHAVQLAMQPDDDAPMSPSAFPTPQFNTVDMPEFLIRRYAFRNRSFLNRDPNRDPEPSPTPDPMPPSDASNL